MSLLLRRRMLLNQKKPLLPSAYQQVEYIESTGTQYIDTEFIPNNKTRVIADFQLTQVTASFVFGTRNANTTTSNRQALTFNINSAGKFIFSHNYPNTMNNADTLRHTIDINKNVATLDSTVFTGEELAFTSPQSLYLFACNETNRPGYLPSKVKLYSCKIYNNRALVRDYIPCYRKSDGVIGLYDLVNDTFNTNIGTGTFKKGGDI